MESVEIKLRGLTPLILKSDRTLDPFDPMVVAMRPIKDKKGTKTDADVRALRRLEWEAGLYMDEELGPVVPGWNLIRSIQDGAKLTKKGKDVIREVTGPMVIPIEYKGPRDIEALYAAGGGRAFVDVRRTVNKGGGGATMRARPIFREWALTAELHYDESVIASHNALVEIIATAGRFAGLGEYRPSSPKGGQYGRYEIAEVNGRRMAA